MKDQDRKQYKTGSGNDPIHDQDTYITKGQKKSLCLIVGLKIFKKNLDLRNKLEAAGCRGKYIIQCKGSRDLSCIGE